MNELVKGQAREGVEEAVTGETTPVGMAEEMHKQGVSKPSEGPDDPELTQKLADLFQSSYKMIYSDGGFDILIQTIEEGGVPIGAAVAQLIAEVISSIVKTGETDIKILYSLGLMLTTDILDSLTQIGVEVGPEVMAQVLSEGIGNVIADSPEIAEIMKNDPELQATMQEVAAKANAEGTGQPQEGVMGQPQVGGANGL